LLILAALSEFGAGSHQGTDGFHAGDGAADAVDRLVDGEQDDAYRDVFDDVDQ
jgi:hypothetical protein